MNKNSLSHVVLGASLLLTVGCGGTTNSGSGGAENTGGAGGGGAETLAGTWEVSGTRYGADQTTGLISLASQQLSIHTEGGSVSAIAKANGSIEVVVTDDTFRDPWDPPPATGTLLASRTAPGVFGVPSLPLDLSGSWAVYDSVEPSPQHGCTSTL